MNNKNFKALFLGASLLLLGLNLPSYSDNDKCLIECMKDTTEKYLSRYPAERYPNKEEAARFQSELKRREQPQAKLDLINEAQYRPADRQAPEFVRDFIFMMRPMCLHCSPLD